MTIPYKLKLINKLSPSLLWQIYLNKSKKNFNDTLFILSFDCDTETDIKVAGDLHSKLNEMGIMPVYAVPGALIQQGKKTYSQILNTGAEFINHGGRAHTYFDLSLNLDASCFFYDQQDRATIEKDILAGHEMLQNELGVKAKGFRTPHFGTFQQQNHLRFLYRTLKKLDYSFSTSTMPVKGYQNGPIYNVDGIFEIPVTGIVHQPFNILDSWAYFAAPDRVKNEADYYIDCNKLSSKVINKPFLINVYADPSHVYDKESFFKGISCLNQVAKNINYSQLVEQYQYV